MGGLQLTINSIYNRYCFWGSFHDLGKNRNCEPNFFAFKPAHWVERLIFGAKSERYIALPADQSMLFEVPAAAVSKEPKKQIIDTRSKPLELPAPLESGFETRSKPSREK